MQLSNDGSLLSGLTSHAGGLAFADNMDTVTTLHVASGLTLHQHNCKSNPVANMANVLTQRSPGKRTKFPKLGTLTGFQATVPVI